MSQQQPYRVTVSLSATITLAALGESPARAIASAYEEIIDLTHDIRAVMTALSETSGISIAKLSIEPFTEEL